MTKTLFCLHSIILPSITKRSGRRNRDLAGSVQPWSGGGIKRQARRAADRGVSAVARLGEPSHSSLNSSCLPLPSVASTTQASRSLQRLLSGLLRSGDTPVSSQC